MTAPMTPSVTRCDLAMPALIFGGLLVTMTAVGGALEGTSAQWVDEIKVVAAEHGTGSDDMDPLTSCKKTAGLAIEMAHRCKQIKDQALLRRH